MGCLWNWIRFFLFEQGLTPTKQVEPELELEAELLFRNSSRSKSTMVPARNRSQAVVKRNLSPFLLGMKVKLTPLELSCVDKYLMHVAKYLSLLCTFLREYLKGKIILRVPA